MPPIAATIPTAWAAPGRSPRAIPATIGTITPVALIGATMLIVPTTIAWKNAARPIVIPRPAPAAATTAAAGGNGSALIATHPPASTTAITWVQKMNCSVPTRRDVVPPRKSATPKLNDDPRAKAGPNTRRSLGQPARALMLDAKPKRFAPILVVDRL